MKIKLWPLFILVLVIATASRLVATENTAEDNDQDMAKVLNIMAYRVSYCAQGNDAVYQGEAIHCLMVLAGTVGTGDIVLQDMTWNGLNYLYREARNQKILYPELKGAFDVFMTHVYNHRVQLEKKW